MAKKPPSAYASVGLDPVPVPQSPAPVSPAGTPEPVRARVGRPSTGQTLRDVSKPTMLYLHPAGLKALKRYALDQNTKVHSLLLEAVETWARAKGISEPMRATTAPERD